MQRTLRSRRPFALLIVLCCLAPACSRFPGDRPQTAVAHGTVRYRGNPVSGAEVRFISEGAPRFATGTTDENGNFTLTTFVEGDGAVIGTHVVTVSKSNVEIPVEDGVRDAEAYERSRAAADVAQKAGSALPERYTDPESSNLSAEVQPGANQVDLELVD